VVDAGRVDVGDAEVTVRQVRLAIPVTDPLHAAGLRHLLAEHVGFTVVAAADEDTADVRVVAVEPPATSALALLRGLSRAAGPTVVVGDLPEAELPAALERGVRAVVAGATVTAPRLADAVTAVLAGDVVLPPGLVAGLVGHLQRLQRDVLGPHGLSSCGLTTRQVAVLRLLADGFDTAEIAARLNYAERTVKSIVGAVTDRLSLRNRTHAVSYALRHNLI
jgi:DNA-binding NarL/FixJ family response regulator